MNNSSSNLVNYTPCPYDTSAVFTSVLAVLSLAAIIGNILVMSAVYKTPNLRTSTNYYYVNMAVSDFLSSLTLWPLYLTDEIITQRGSLIQGFIATIGCKVGVFTRNVSHSVSILSLFLIAVDRFIATVHPLKVTLLTKNIRASLLLSTCMDHSHREQFYHISSFKSRQSWARNVLQIGSSHRQDYNTIHVCNNSTHCFVFLNFISVSAHHACFTK